MKSNGRPPKNKPRWWTPLLEISLILLWALWVGRAYLNLDPGQWPNGREFGMVVQPHFVWTLLRECGTCMLWDGFANGGMPAFAQLQAPILHPLMVIPTLLFGGVNGAKLMLIGSLMMAGLGQWWLARVMGLGWIARLWSAALIISGGHLAARLEVGVVGVVLSTAACSLAIAPGLKLAQNGRRRDAVLLGMVLALAIVSGQGYMQLGLLFAILPAFLVYLLDADGKLRPVRPFLREFLLAGGLALLLAAVFLVPLAHFWPNFGKDVNFDFGWAQPIQYLPLNFVNNNVDFYYTDALGKLPYPYLNMNFIGWIPVLLAGLPLFFLRKETWRQLLFFVLALALVLLAGGDSWFMFGAGWLPGSTIFIRAASLITGLAVPQLVGLATWGVDDLLRLLRGKWTARAGKTAVIPFLALFSLILILAALLPFSLYQTYQFSQLWYTVQPTNPELAQVITAAKTAGTQWVTTPFGEHFWGPAAAAQNVKLTRFVQPYYWQGREDPPPFIEITRDAIPANQPNYWRRVNAFTLLTNRENPYAAVTIGDEISYCLAEAKGGQIDVYCNTGRPGVLVVEETSWSGWQVGRDGRRVSLNAGPWLSVEAPAGEHVYSFRYVPWDVFLGLGLTIIGLFLAVWLWLRNAPNPPGGFIPGEPRKASPSNGRLPANTPPPVPRQEKPPPPKPTPAPAADG
jgi:hypothetical protein